MPVPISQMWTVATYVLKQKLKGRKRYPFVLMLEPLFRCNLACAGCGKIQYPAHILKTDLTPEECFKAVDECGTPMVSIPGGEPLMHPQIDKIVEGLVARKKYIYLCTNALLLKEKLHLFKPSKYLTFSVHVDGQREHHDFSVCREGGYEVAIEGIREAIQRGFRVTTNTTLFDGADPKSVRAFFDETMDFGVERMMQSPGNKYGTESGNPKCGNCMVHSGYEASAVDHTFNSWRGFFGTVRATFSSSYRDDDALRMLERPAAVDRSVSDLVQLETK